MESDEEIMDEPPAEYLRMRRRSNTLPTEILRHMKDKQKLKSDVDVDETDAKDSPLSGSPQSNVIHSSELSDRLKHLVIDDSNHKHKSEPHHTKLYHDEIKDTHLLKPVRAKNGHHRKPHARGIDALRSNMIRTTSDETLLVKTKRGPLPRGSHIYEEVLKDFGHDEEDRDFLSPLPSPQISRRSKHGINHINLVGRRDVTQSAPSSPPRRHVHWNENIN